MRVLLLFFLAGVALHPGCGSKQDSLQQERISLEEQSLYSRIGGIEVLRVLVDEWILEVASDARIRDYFVHTSIATIKLRLVERLCTLASGPCMYRGKDVYSAHAKLHIGDEQIKAFMDDYDAAILRTEISKPLAAELRKAILGLAAAIPTRALPESGPLSP